jgi:hypothetical protein
MRPRKEYTCTLVPFIVENEEAIIINKQHAQAVPELSEHILSY